MSVRRKDYRSSRSLSLSSEQSVEIDNRTFYFCFYATILLHVQLFTTSRHLQLRLRRYESSKETPLLQRRNVALLRLIWSHEWLEQNVFQCSSGTSAASDNEACTIIEQLVSHAKMGAMFLRSALLTSNTGLAKVLLQLDETLGCDGTASLHSDVSGRSDITWRKKISVDKLVADSPAWHNNIGLVHMNYQLE